MTSFSSVQHNGLLSYLRATAGYTTTLIAAIEARPNGEIIVDKRLLYTDGTTSGALEIARANFTDFRYDVGPYSQSVTLSGTKTVTNGSPVSRTVTSLISTRKGDDGKRTFTVGLDAGIKPGDTAIVDAEYVPIESVRYTVSSTDKRLELKEL